MEHRDIAITKDFELGDQEIFERIVNQYVFEMYSAALRIGYTFNDEQLSTLQRAYLANDDEKEGRSSLESFFGSIPLETFKQIDIASFTYLHLLKWYDMLLMAGYTSFENTTHSGFLSGGVLGRLVARMPPCIKSEYWHEFVSKFPDKAGEFNDSEAPIGLCQSCNKIFYAMIFMPLPIDKLIKVMLSIEPCPYPDSFLDPEFSGQKMLCA